MLLINRRFLHGLLIALPAFFFSACNSSGSGHTGKEDSSVTARLPDPVPLAPGEETRLKAACQAWYDSALAPRGFNGGILVAKNGNIVFEKYSGTSHIPGTDTINETTPLHIASVSKTFTAMAVLKLWQDGRLNLDDEYGKYFPAFNYPGVTIRSLLNHRSGLPNYTHFLDNLGWDKNKMASNEDVLDFLINRKAELVDISAPNTHFTYCNTNYALLALLIEKVSGRKYGDFINQAFFIPLQMKNSYVFTAADTSRAIPSYNWRGKIEPLNFLDMVYGDKNIYTTVRDILTWDRALYTNLFFSPETLAQAYAGYSNERPGIRNYGLGWRMYNYPNDKKIIYHNGWWHGSNASFNRLINDSATIIVIGNRFTRAIYHAKAMASVFGNYSGTSDEEDAEQSSGQHLPSDSMLKTPVPGISGKTKKQNSNGSQKNKKRRSNK